MLGHVWEPPWSSNSISNLCKRIAKEQKADDVRKTLEVFKDLKKQDPGFQFSVDYDARTRLKLSCGALEGAGASMLVLEML